MTRLRIDAEARPAAGPESSGLSRRDFLKAGWIRLRGRGPGRLPAGPEQYAVPYLVPARRRSSPARSYHYASTCGGCSAGCGLLVKNRDGRPIKLEGNPEHPLSRGGLCAAGQASLLGLYDQQPLAAAAAARNGRPTGPRSTRRFARQLDAIRTQGRAGALPDRSARQPDDACHDPALSGDVRRRPPRGLRSALLLGHPGGTRSHARRPACCLITTSTRPR